MSKTAIKLKIGMISKEEHAKAHAEELTKLGHTVVMLGANPTINDFSATLDLLICRTVSCSHGASAAALQASRSGKLPVIFEDSVTQITKAVGMHVATREATAPREKVAEPKVQLQPSTIVDKMPVDVRKVYVTLPAGVKSIAEKAMLLFALNAPYGLPLANRSTPDVVDQMSSIGFPVSKRAELAAIWNDLHGSSSAQHHRLREFMEAMVKAGEVKAHAYWWYSQRNGQTGRHVIYAPNSISSDKIDDLAEGLKLYKERPGSAPMMNLHGARSQEEQKAGSKLPVKTPVKKPTPTPVVPEVPEVRTPAVRESYMTKHLTAYYHPKAKTWYIRANKGHPSVDTYKTVLSFPGDTPREKVVAETDRLQAELSGPPVKKIDVLLPPEPTAPAAEKSLYRRNNPVQGEYHASYREGGGSNGKGRWYVRATAKHPTLARRTQLGSYLDREDAERRVKELDESVRSILGQAKLAQVEIKPIEVKVPSPVYIKADLDTAIEMLIEQMRSSGKTTIDTPFLRIELKAVHLSWMGARGCTTSVGAETTSLSEVTCPECRASTAFKTAEWVLKNVKAG